MQKILSRAFGYWLPLLVLLTGVMGFAFLAVQQNYRQSLNDPQIQIAEDAATAITSGTQIDQVVPVGKLDMASSLGTWMTVYTNTGVPLLSSGELDGAPPQLPAGLFDPSTWTFHKTFSAPTGVETRITWQPRPMVRQAVVLVHYDSPNGIGYVAVGRSMRVVEERILALFGDFEIAWSATALGTLVALIFVLALGWL